MDPEFEFHKEEVDLDKLMDAVKAVTGKEEVHLDKLVGGVQAVTGEKIDRQSVPDFVSHMGIALTDSEQQQLLRTLPVDGGKVKRSRVNSFLENVGVRLTEKELEKLMEDLPFSGWLKVLPGQMVLEFRIELESQLRAEIAPKYGENKEEVDLDKLMDAVKAVTGKEEVHLDKLVGGVQAVTGEKIDRQSVPDFVSHMGIALTDSEQQQLLRTLPVDASGKTSQTSLRESKKSFKGGKVKRSRVNSFLENVGVKLTEKELEKLIDDLPFNDKEEVDLDKLIDRVQAVKGGMVNANDINIFLGNMGINLTGKQLENLTESLLVNGEDIDIRDIEDALENMGVKLTDKERLELFQMSSASGEKFDVNKLDTVLGNMRISLTEKELGDLADHLPVNDDGTVDMKKVVDELKTITERNIDSSSLKPLLEKMHIKLTEKEFGQLTENLPADGGIVNINDVKTVLENMGIEPKDSIYWEMVKNLPFDSEKIDSNDLKNLANLGVELTEKEQEMQLQTQSTKEEKIKKDDLFTCFEKIGLQLTEEELNELSEKLRMNGKVDLQDLETLLNNIGIELTDQQLEHLTENLPISGEKIGSDNLQNILQDMGIEHMDEEQKRLLDRLPVDGGKLNTHDLDTILDAMEVEFTEEERDLIKNYLSDSAEIDLENLMDIIETIMGREIDVNDLETVLGSMGIEFTDKEKELPEIVSILPVKNQKIFEKNLLDGIKYFKGAKIDPKKMDTVLKKMGINLTEKELKDVTQNLPVGVNGKVGMAKLMNEVRSFSGDKINISELEDILENLGVELMPTEHFNLIKTLPINDDGKVYLKRMLKGVKSLKEGNVDTSKLDTLLENMGINITEREFMDLMERLPVDDRGEIKLNTVVEELSSVLGEPVDANDIYHALEDMQVEFTNKDYMNLVKTLPVDVEGKVYQKWFQDAIKTLKGGKVDRNNLNKFLKHMGVILSQKELEDFLRDLPTDADGKVELKNVTQRMKDFVGEKIHVSDLKNVLKDMGIEVNHKEYLEVLKSLPVDDDEKIFQNRLLTALRSFKGGKIDGNKLKTVLGKMAIKLKNKELKDLVQKLPVDADGNIPLNKIMSHVKTVRGKKFDAKDLKNTLKNIGIEFTPKEFSELAKHLYFDDDGSIYENRLLDGVRSFKGEEPSEN
ncbi:uncharacterized protein LOC132541787 [Erinaceus europaeus]|uniref:Uncharacterized protein LOC132541787 n=1 Tax=Erinaceus europaeus TaxID=9365 RepID=A0ABM3YBN3_ERIEU|nr:uncharacterized protein LOC132541787 [Erinaceus europaeus]